MIRLLRPAAPPVLIENSVRWGMEFAALRKDDPAAQFRWKSYEGAPLNRFIRRFLNEMSAGHCSYCDGFPLGEMSLETIDHFKPKSLFPDLCYAWENLFVACDVCQNRKGEKFDNLLLKPDEIDYDFDKYFQVNFLEGALEPNATASESDRKRAAFTIKIFDLNSVARCESRKRSLRHYEGLSVEDRQKSKDDFSYRFMLA